MPTSAIGQGGCHPENVGSRAVATADFPAEIDILLHRPSTAALRTTPAARQLIGPRRTTNCSRTKKKTFVLIYRISESAYNSWFESRFILSASPFTSGHQKVTGSYSSETGELVVGEVEKA